MSNDHVIARQAQEHAAQLLLGTYEWRPGTDELLWSPELVRLYGRDVAPSSEQEFAALLHPDDRVRVEAETTSFLGSSARSYSHTFRIIRPDGEIRVMLDRAVIERDERGNVRAIHGINIDVTAEAQLNDSAFERLREQEGRYRALFQSIDQGFCVLQVDLGGPDRPIDYRVVEANPAFFENTGFPPSIVGRWLREAAPQLEEHWYQAYGEVARTGEAAHFEQNSDLLGRWFDVCAFRMDAEEHYVGVLFSDITGRRRHAEHAHLLVSEVSHRSKNMLSIIQAIARQTASTGADDFFERFSKRIRALGAQQDLLYQNAWQTVPLDDLARSQLAHFSDLLETRIELVGPPLPLTPDAAQALGMAFHELATNAAKYGALSNHIGRVQLHWSLQQDAASGAVFQLSWLERDGPPAEPPARRGFGSVVTKEMVEASTGGQVVVNYFPTGLAWLLTCPVDQIRAKA